MVRYIKEDEVKRILRMADVVSCVEHAFRDRAQGKAFDIPRRRTLQPGGHLHILQAAAPQLNLIGFKAYYLKPESRTFYLHLINHQRGNQEALIEADWLGRMRTGAATGVATDALAPKSASVVACFGTGRHAQTQLEGVACVRRLTEVRAFGRNRERQAGFCDAMSRKLGVTVKPVHSEAEALAGAHIVNVMTRSDTPLFDGRLLAPGQHINAAGSNALDRREVDLEAVRRARVVVDSREVARGECGDLLPAIERGLLYWEQVADLGEVLIGQRPGRTSDDDITLFESHGMGLQDLYTGRHVLELARAQGVGVDLPIGD
ncbi:MAG: ornithine cyclodeaminase family protein [Burkholderiales bacterium]|nr:ornithine cyclodeaminase family protein [Burkholderiales bacterium]